MKKTHFKIGLLTACLISVSSVASAQTCGAESCDSGACKCSKRHCDDKGLLEVINNAASNFEAKLANMIPDRDKPCAKAKCTCDKCSRPSDFAIQYTEIAPMGSASSGSLPHFTPPVAQPDVLHPPAPPMMVPKNSIGPVPQPHQVPHKVPPLPDSRVNPFKDDPNPTTRNLRQVPARPASYLHSNSNLEDEFDPQASNQQRTRSVHVARTATKSISDSSNGLATTTSTRRVQSISTDVSKQVEYSVSEQAPPEVVPASLSQPVTTLRSLPTMPPPADQFINPLRAQ